MSKNIICLASGQPVEPAEVNPDGANLTLVNLLEGLLQEARTGEIKSLAYSAVRHDDGIATGWDAEGGVFMLLAAVTVLNGRINNHVQQAF
jgi:hypothetical protein